jgi:transcriptional regulator NrdR family protein
MKCPFCGHTEDRVVDSRDVRSGCGGTLSPRGCCRERSVGQSASDRERVE